MRPRSLPLAAPIAFRKDYSNHAVISATLNNAYHRGLTGIRWKLSHKDHYAWFRPTTEALAMSDRLARKGGIVSCHGYPHDGQ